MQQLSEILQALPTAWLENYVRTFEAGRVQRHPHARFVNAAGECCLVAAMAGARSARELVASELWLAFAGSELEELSRRFETLRVRGHEVYDEALLALASRAAAESLVTI